MHQYSNYQKKIAFLLIYVYSRYLFSKNVICISSENVERAKWKHFPVQRVDDGVTRPSAVRKEIIEQRVKSKSRRGRE